MSDKEKHSSKLFGSRISSIFNTHSEPSSARIIVPKQQQNTLKPLSKPPLNKRPLNSSTSLHPYTSPQPEEGPKSPVLSRDHDSGDELHSPVQQLLRSPPRRKPPPPLLDLPHYKPLRELERLPSMSQLEQTPMSQRDHDITDGINDIIGSLEHEIDAMMLQSGLERNPVSPQPHPNLLNLSTPMASPQTRLLPRKSDTFRLSRSPGSIALAEYQLDYLESSKSDSQYDSSLNRALELGPSAPYPVELSPEGQEITMDSLGGDWNDSSSTNNHETSAQSRGSVSSALLLATGETGIPNDAFLAGTSSRKPSGMYGSSGSLILRQPSLTRQLVGSGGANSGRAPLKPVSSNPTDPYIDGLSRGTTTTSSSFIMAPGTPTSVPLMPANHHRKSGSISSIMSSNSYRNVNLATLKKTLNLQPGEGERSNYVLNIRKSAGTAYNESGPGKWKLPTGILPVDKNASYLGSNGRYLRLAGGVSQGRGKRASGVELKHGHLQKRLLAAEVDNVDEGGIGMRGILGALLTNGQFLLPKMPVSEPVRSSNSSIGASSTGISTSAVSRSSSLARMSTGMSLGEGMSLGDAQSIVTGKSTSTYPSSKRSSSSSGSISDGNVVDGFYQHPGYKYESGGEQSEDEVATEVDTAVEQDDDEDYDYDDKPRLVLANPDASDSD